MDEAQLCPTLHTIVHLSELKSLDPASFATICVETGWKVLDARVRASATAKRSCESSTESASGMKRVRVASRSESTIADSQCASALLAFKGPRVV
jgi:hypothetical protein